MMAARKGLRDRESLNMERARARRRNQKINRRKHTLLKKCYEMTELCDVALFLRIRKSGHLTVFKSTRRKSWPPSEEEIVSAMEYCWNHTNRAVARNLSDPCHLIAGRHGSEVCRGSEGHYGREVVVEEVGQSRI